MWFVAFLIRVNTLANYTIAFTLYVIVITKCAYILVISVFVLGIRVSILTICAETLVLMDIKKANLLRSMQKAR